MPPSNYKVTSLEESKKKSTNQSSEDDKMNVEKFIESVEPLDPKERKILLKQLKGKLKILSDVKITKKQIARQLERAELVAQTNRLQQKLYYIEHKDELNQKRKLYKRTRK